MADCESTREGSKSNEMSLIKQNSHSGLIFEPSSTDEVHSSNISVSDGTALQSIPSSCNILANNRNISSASAPVESYNMSPITFNLNRIMSDPDPQNLASLTPIKIDYLNTNSPLSYQSSKSIIAIPKKMEGKKSKVDDSIDSISKQVYRENLNSISNQMIKLMNDLNHIYNKIGYTNNEIHQNESVIFNHFSKSIENYYSSANEKMNALSLKNDLKQQYLNRILEIINDPSGIKTIPDLYIRNGMVNEEYKNAPSPRKELTLLNKEKILNKSRVYILDKYIPLLLEYLDNVIKFRKILKSTGDEEIKTSTKISGFNNDNSTSNLAMIPTMENAIHLYKNLKTLYGIDSTKILGNEISMENIEAEKYDNLMNFITENKNMILYNNTLNNISEKRTKETIELIDCYKLEYIKRLKELIFVSQSTFNLLKQLHIHPKIELNQDINRQINLFSSIELNSIESEVQNNTYHIVDAKTMVDIEKVHQHYQAICSNRSSEKNQLLRKCQQLWSVLKIPNHEINQFISANRDLSIQNIKNYKTEIQRLHDLKKKWIKTLINDSKKRIQELWDHLQYSNERSMFLNEIAILENNSNSLSDDELILSRCEEEIKDLESKAKICDPILKLLEEFKLMQKDQAQLEDGEKNSTRLFNRDSHKVLMIEEKLRKKITRYFPKVIQELKLKLEEFKIEFHKEFMYMGESLFDLVVKQETELYAKYPRIKYNISTRTLINSPTKSMRNKTTNNVTKKSISPKKINKKVRKNLEETLIKEVENISNNTTHFLSKTPIGKCTTMNNETNNMTTKSDSFNKDFSSTISTHQSITSSINNDHNESPTESTRLLPPTVITRNSPSRIPVPKFKKNSPDGCIPPPKFNVNSVYSSSGFIRPTTLFPVTQQRLNRTQSNIPTIHVEPKDILKLLSDGNKENEAPSSSPQGKNSIKQYSKEFQSENYEVPQNSICNTRSSPFREPENSVYKITTSPEGKHVINIKGEINNSIYDDTSIMDNENDIDYEYLNWQNERFSKLEN
ncbi:hypothetical protein TBLA_0J00960 [Henningerozyma blattae CBS 6284]|uniref:Anaphase spindle elongation protein n=1 Tax=Henningerozyma blattae (strain ATCC 34711 / CBS 6284 / DSM 70876 / NBRC 10599 / NRRL Y-10934 / UCD 77-7) TaxID=1071380 RepID=I2H9P2_HENB6|nr:hypothetical protein TBLA_0J00960 [Tetrapisispora blattae CBS 6284]CCH63094.1 hypothetical protein TBLA_0J00960 [Tetrapisispora blattae CBS 6284]